MSYAEQLRGALAATSGVARRITDLRALGLTDAQEAAVEAALDDATDRLIGAVNVLREAGVLAPGIGSIAASAGQDKSWRETVYGGKKSSGDIVAQRAKMANIIKRSKEVPKLPPVESEQDAAHPWRTS